MATNAKTAEGAKRLAGVPLVVWIDGAMYLEVTRVLARGGTSVTLYGPLSREGANELANELRENGRVGW
jgi:hypothetical protein